MAAKKNHRDYGLVLGEALTSSCASRRKSHGQDGERTALLEPRKKQPVKRPSWSEVFSPQSRRVLLAYALMSMHTMAFDSLLPVFLHNPVQEFEGNPDVRLPFKFVGGFGVGGCSIPIGEMLADESRFPNHRYLLHSDWDHRHGSPVPGLPVGREAVRGAQLCQGCGNRVPDSVSADTIHGSRARAAAQHHGVLPDAREVVGIDLRVPVYNDPVDQLGHESECAGHIERSGHECECHWTCRRAGSDGAGLYIWSQAGIYPDSVVDVGGVWGVECDSGVLYGGVGWVSCGGGG